MSSNDIQIGGNHYQKNDYQHWDFVCDLDLHYLIGNATKYIARWRNKNGVEDLRKALHYISKAVERNIETPPKTIGFSRKRVEIFTLPLKPWDRKVILAIIGNNYGFATSLLNDAIADIECGATKEYTNQDPYWRG